MHVKVPLLSRLVGTWLADSRATRQKGVCDQTLPPPSSCHTRIGFKFIHVLYFIDWSFMKFWGEEGCGDAMEWEPLVLAAAWASATLFIQHSKPDSKIRWMWLICVVREAPLTIGRVLLKQQLVAWFSCFEYSWWLSWNVLLLALFLLILLHPKLSGFSRISKVCLINYMPCYW